MSVKTPNTPEKSPTQELFDLLFNEQGDDTTPKKRTKKRAKKYAPKAEQPRKTSTDIVKDSAEPETVYALTQRIRHTLESSFGRVWLVGEISNFTVATSGHLYFTLKDERAQINAIMFRSSAIRLRVTPEEGMMVVVRGDLSVYPPQGKYQIVCDALEPHGIGARQRAFEELKQKLIAEGLCDATRKKELPFFPRTIAVVTSPTGAAIRDICHVLTRRAPYARIIINPTTVQGDQAAPRIAEAIAECNDINTAHQNDPSAQPLFFDVLIVGRGGGSVEDLWPFNEEIVARAIIASDIPVISAVGHETDWSIADLVADVRAPTPSAAAEIVAPAQKDLHLRIATAVRHIRQSVLVSLTTRSQRLATVRTHYALREPERYVRDLRQQLDDTRMRMQQYMHDNVSRTRTRLTDAQHAVRSARHMCLMRVTHARTQYTAVATQFRRSVQRFITQRRDTLLALLHALDALGPAAVLRRGYTITREAETSLPLTSATAAKDGMRLTTQFHDGAITSIVSETKNAKKKHST